MSLSLTRLEWIDAPAAAHELADAIAAAARPRDFASPPPLCEQSRPAPTLRAGTLTAVVAAHAALVLAATLAWRAVAPVSEATEEIPVEIVVEASQALREPALTETLPPPLAAQATAAEVASTEPAPTQTVERQQAEDDAAQHAQASAPTSETSAPALAQAADDAAIEQQRREAAARRRAAQLADARAARLADERAELELERRAQAKRAAERERQAQAAQERRRIAARSPAPEPARPSANVFDAAAYRAVVARAVSGSASRSCPGGGGGRVVVALLIAPSGRVASASLSSASGNAVLDTAALAAVRRAGPFPAPSNHASVSVPVVVICR